MKEISNHDQNSKTQPKKSLLRDLFVDKSSDDFMLSDLAMGTCNTIMPNPPMEARTIIEDLTEEDFIIIEKIDRILYEQRETFSKTSLEIKSGPCRT